MVGPDRIALRIGGLAARTLVGFVGLVVIVGPLIPAEGPATGSRSDPGDPARSPITVTLRIPGGEQVGHVMVVDETGRELAIVSRWRDGQLAVVSRRNGEEGATSVIYARKQTVLRSFDATGHVDLVARPGEPPKFIVQTRSHRPDPSHPSTTSGTGDSGATGPVSPMPHPGGLP
jgi:hypothetical protein